MHAGRPLGVLVAAGALLAGTRAAPAAGLNSTLLLSRPTGLGALPVPGDNFAAVGPKAITGDGSLIVFTSQADDLGVRDTGNHVWVRTVLGATTLVDRVPVVGAPGDGFVNAPAVSRDGAKVCFVGNATNLVSGITGFHVFVVTLSSGAITVADRADGVAGAVGNDNPFRCALDAAGTRVVFDSRADNLVPVDTNSAIDVFVRDLVASTTTRVSVDSSGAQTPFGGNEGAISADGVKIAFTSGGALLAGDTNGFADIYVRDTQANTLVRASLGTGSQQANGSSSRPAIDDTGSHVAFLSDATNLEISGDTNGKRDVFWRDLTGSDTTVLVSRATGPGGALGDTDSSAPAISGDGQGVAFESAATTLGAGAPVAGTLAYLRRISGNETLLLSRASGATGAPANGTSGSVSLTTAPTTAVFGSVASNLDADASGDFSEVFRRELAGTPTTTLVSRPTGTSPRSGAVNTSVVTSRGISADGRLVIVVSQSNGLDPAAAGPFFQVFVRDVVTNTLTLVSRGQGLAGAVGNGDSIGGAISADGTHVAFLSNATNLLGGVTTRQIYVRNLATDDLQVASRADGLGLVLATVGSGGPDISGDGSRVSFTAEDALVPADTNSRSDIYVRDMVAGTTILASVGAGGVLGDNDSSQPSLSGDGMRVAFTSFATNLIGPSPPFASHIYVRDMAADTTVLADRRAMDGAPGTENAQSPYISGAGNRVVFLAIDEVLTAEPIPGRSALYVRDLTTNTTILVSRGDGPAGVDLASIDASPNHDGTRVSFSALGPGLPGPPETSQVYVRDLVAGTTTLASAVDGTTDTPGNAFAFGSALSAGGGCVAFDSAADNLTTPSYPTQDFNQVYLRVAAGECPEGGATTSTTLPPSLENPFAARSAVLRPGKLAKFASKGVGALPPAAADPTVGGGRLALSGTTGIASYDLPASGWKPVGRRRKPKGFKFKGPTCRVAFLQRRIAAVCRRDTGALRLPEPGPLEMLLTLGSFAAYCGECGGVAAGNPARVFKRKRCAAPATCP